MQQSAKESTFVRARWLPIVGISICIPILLGQSDISADNVARDIGSGRWDWTVFIKASPSVLSRIRCVSYHLDPTFPNPERVVCDSGQSGRPFALNAQAWKEFDIPIEIMFEDGRKQHLSYHLRLQASLSTEEELRRELLQKHLVPSAQHVKNFSFDALSSHVAIVVDDGTAEILETVPAAASKARRILTVNHVVAVHFEQDGNSLTALVQNGYLFSFDAATGKNVRRPGTASLSIRNIHSAGFNSAGNLLVTRVNTSSGSRVDIWAFPSGRHLYAVEAAKGVVWSEDDRRIASVGNDGTAEVIDLKPNLKTVKIRRSGILNGAFTPDGRGIAFATGETNVPVFSVENGLKILSFDFGNPIDSVSFNPDKSSIIATSPNGMAYLRDLKDGQTTEIAIGVRKGKSVGFSRDGRWLLVATDAGELRWYPMRIADLQALLKNKAHN